MSLPDDFSAITFLYLNPELAAFSNVTTVEAARDRYLAEFSHLHYVLPGLASADADLPFVPDVYIAQNRQDIDVSRLNGIIEMASRNTNEDEDEDGTGDNDGTSGPHYTEGTYVANFYRKLRLRDSNVFVFDNGTGLEPDTLITPCNLRVGDDVKIMKDDGRSVLYGEVVALEDEHAFRVRDQTGADVTDFAATYLMFGIRVQDAERLAHVNYTRRFHQGFSNEDPAYPAKPFNPELYKLLYPDARFLTEGEAFVSYHNNWATNEFRISKASDIPNADTPYFVMDTATQFASDVEFMDKVHWKGVTLCNVSTDFVTSHEDASEAALITEYAIKRYVDDTRDALRQTRTFEDVVVENVLRSSSNLTVTPDAMVAKSDVAFEADLRCDGMVSSREMFAGDRVGIGSRRRPEQPEQPESGTAKDVRFRNSTVTGSLVVESGDGSGSGWSWDATTSPTAAQTTLDTLPLGATIDEHPLSLRHSSSPSDVPPLMMFIPGQVHTHGNVFVKGGVYSLSDAATKTDVLPISDALEKVAKLRGYTYAHAEGAVGEARARDDGNSTKHDHHDKRRFAGLMAQDVEAVLPEVITRSSVTGNLSIAYGNLTALLVEAVNELRREVESLRAEIGPQKKSTKSSIQTTTTKSNNSKIRNSLHHDADI
jgi:hypothetical protein